MNNISEQILEAVDVLTDAKLSKLRYDRTVRATIYSIINVDSGIYYVRFEGNVFTAYAEDIEKKYKIDEEVYIRIPEGDFSNKKIIAGRVTELSLSQGQITQLTNSIIDISPTFDKFYNFEVDAPWKVIAGAPQNENKQGIDYIYGKEDNSYSSTQFHGLFQQYASKYEYIRIKADFKTQFHDVHTRGNYGIEVAFFTKGENNTISTVTYKLDFESFSGDPYSFSVFSPQQIIFKTQTNYLLGLKYIRLFQNDFRYDTQVTNYDTGDRTAITTIPNIFVQNVQINYVDVIDLTKEPYYCYIAAPKGSIFSPITSSIDLEAKLLSYGELVNIDRCEYRWFKRDLSVFIGNDLYDKDVGFGWKPIDNDTAMLTIEASEVIYQQRYKCIVIYNDEVVMTAEREILNINNNYGYHIEQITEGDIIKLQLINDKTNDVLTGNWYISYPDGNYSSLQQGKNVNYINVEDYLTYTSVVFYCEVYSYDKQNIVGTIEHTIFNSESEEDVTITYIGEDTFRYDANGDVTIEDSEKERTIQVKLAWKEGYGTSYRVEWIGPDGADIPKNKPTTSENGYKPKDSMIENIWVDKSNILHYNIKYKYKVNYNNNTFTVKIITIDEKIYTFNKEILFMKDGDQGTNGTTYVTAIRPCGTTGDKLSGFQALRYYNGGWHKTLNLRCYVYKDGELINNNPNYNIIYKWYPIGVILDRDNIDRVTVTGRGSISTNSAGEDLQRYVKVSTQIRDNVNDRDTMIYALYPIDVVYGSTLSDSLIDISDIPSYIKYTASGINPSFYSNNIIFQYNKTDYTGETVTSGIISLTPNVLEVEIKDGYKYLKPATSFIFEEDIIGILKCQYTASQFIIHPIIMYLDTYGNEAVNGWDGTKLAIDEDKGQYIFAPQIGAGEKDSANRFTGVVMGKDSASADPITHKTLIGLYGYQSGINTFGLMQNGRAFFGAKSGGGQIIIDGTSAEIYGGGDNNQKGGDSKTGMTIALANLNPSEPEKVEAIKVSQGKFAVYYSGKMMATEADIAGMIYALGGQIGCDDKKKGGWYITKDKLYSGLISRKTYVELNSDENSKYAIIAGKSDQDVQLEIDENTGLITKCNAPFLVTREGTVYANNASIKGTVEADYIVANKKGQIAGWILDAKRLYSNPNENGSKYWVELNSSSKYSIMIGVDTSKYSITTNQSNILKEDIPFFVTPNGTVQATTAEISGTIYAQKGAIGCSGKMQKDGWIIEQYKLSSGSGSNTVALGSNPDEAFRIWAGSSKGGTAYDLSKTPKQRITSPAHFVVTKDGFVYMKDCYVEGEISSKEGEIGGWTIKSTSLSSNKNTIGLASSGTYRFWAGADDGTAGATPTFNKNAYFYVKSDGEVCANKGKIGGWSLTKTQIENSNKTVYLKSNGSARFGNFTITAGGTIKLGSGNTDVDTEYTDNYTQDNYGPVFSVSKNGRLHCTSANIDGTVTIGGSIIADNLYLRNGSNKGSNIITTRNNTKQIGGDYINCRGLNVKGTNGSYFKVDTNGNVSIKGTIILDSNSTITWNQISDADSQINIRLNPLQTAISQTQTDINNLSSDLDDLDDDLTTNIGYVNNFVRKFGYTSISNIGINTPTLNAGWITAGKIDTDRIDVSKIMSIGGGSISITGASTAPSAIQISAQSMRCKMSQGSIYLEAGSNNLQIYNTGGAVAAACSGPFRIDGWVLNGKSIQQIGKIATLEDNLDKLTKRVSQLESKGAK